MAIEEVKLKLETLSLKDRELQTELATYEREEQELRMRLANLLSRSNILRLKHYDNKMDANRLQRELYLAELAEKERRQKEEELRKLQDEQLAIESQLAILTVEIEMMFTESEPWKKIRPFQKNDILYIIGAYKRGMSGVLNANDLGLGKTCETAFCIEILRNLMRVDLGREIKVLWLTKKSLVSSSSKELKKWCPAISIVPISNATPEQRDFLLELGYSNNAVIMTNYDSMSTTPALMQKQWDIVVMDEVHKLKGGAQSNPTQIFRNAQKVIANCKFFIPLSGSPIQNHPREMWTYLHLFAPKKFPSVHAFENMFCQGYGKSWSINFDSLLKVMKGQVIRRRRDEVKLDLPPLTFDYENCHEVELGGDQRRIYDKMRQEFFIWLDNEKEKALTATAIIAQLTRLRQIALDAGGLQMSDVIQSAKVEEAMDLIDDIIASGEQVVVFSSQFNEPLFHLKQLCDDKEYPCEIISGATSFDVANIEERFQQGTTKVICANMKMAAEGLNLQKSPNWPGGACHVILLDLWWNPALNDQAVGRVYRQGQTDPVEVHILQAKDTVDTFIKEIVIAKANMIQGVMEADVLRKGSDWKNHLKGLL